MGKMRLIPGEKKKIREAIKKEIEKNGPISDKRKREIAKQIHKKEKRKVMIGLLAGAIGLAGIGAAGVKMLNQPEESKTKQEGTKEPGADQDKTGKDDFKDGLKVDEQDLVKDEKSEMEKAVDALNNKADVLYFLKDMYIEQYEKQTGDESLTTADITITYNHENYVYVDNKTGEMITHGERPAETEQKLKENGVSWEYDYDVEVYKVRTKEGKILDCVTYKDDVPKSVVIGSQYNESQESVLVNMGTVIKAGINYIEHIEKDEASIEITKKDFVKSLEEFNELQLQKEDNEIGE